MEGKVMRILQLVPITGKERFICSAWKNRGHQRGSRLDYRGCEILPIIDAIFCKKHTKIDILN